MLTIGYLRYLPGLHRESVVCVTLVRSCKMLEDVDLWQEKTGYTCYKDLAM